MRSLRTLWNGQRGASMLEYTILLGLIIAGTLVAVTSVGSWLGTRWATLLHTLVDPD